MSQQKLQKGQSIGELGDGNGMYVMGSVAAVPNGNKEAYREHARLVWEACKAHGALSMTEAWGTDVPDGKVTSFPMAVKKGADETVVFGWVVWPSKAVADVAMEKMMGDDAFMDMQVPFDGKRVIFGFFEPLVVGSV